MADNNPWKELSIDIQQYTPKFSWDSPLKGGKILKHQAPGLLIKTFLTILLLNRQANLSWRDQREVIEVWDLGSF